MNGLEAIYWQAINAQFSKLGSPRLVLWSFSSTRVAKVICLVLQTWVPMHFSSQIHYVNPSRLMRPYKKAVWWKFGDCQEMQCQCSKFKNSTLKMIIFIWCYFNECSGLNWFEVISHSVHQLNKSFNPTALNHLLNAWDPMALSNYMTIYNLPFWDGSIGKVVSS